MKSPPMLTLWWVQCSSGLVQVTTALGVRDWWLVMGKRQCFSVFSIFIPFLDSLAFPSLIVYEHWRGFIQMFIVWQNIHDTYSHNVWEADNLCIKHSSAHERKFTDESKEKHSFMSINITIDVTTWRCLLKTIIVIGCLWTFLITSPELFWWYRVPGRSSLL